MSVREKLVELLRDVQYLGGLEEKIADHLIAHGVTVQEWISVTERLPERTLPPHDVLVYHDLGCGMFVDRAWYSYEKNKWMSAVGMNLNVTHWMPMPPAPEDMK